MSEGRYRLEIWHDPDTEDPSREDGSLFEFVSFSTRHRNFQHPDDIDPQSVLFGLSYYEHGLCRWSLAGEGISDPWDSVQNAGAILPGPYMTLDPDYWGTLTDEQRKEAARLACEEYTDWCNGSTYGYTITREEQCEAGEWHEAELIDSCGGYIGEKWLAQVVKEGLAYRELYGAKLGGEFGYVLEHHDWRPERIEA